MALSRIRRTAGLASADGNRRNVAAAASSRPIPLPAREAVRVRPRHAAPGRDVRAIRLTGEDGNVRVRRCWSGAIIDLLGEHDLTTAMTVEDCLRDVLADGSVALGAASRTAPTTWSFRAALVCAPAVRRGRLVERSRPREVYDTRGQALCAAALWAS